jgi:hypothetical protein
VLKAEEISGFYQNCHGLRTKLFNFNCNVASVNYVFIILTETWLIDSISDSELGLPNYNIYRYDRNNITSNCLRGGGVLIGIRKDLSSKLISVPISNVEHVGAQATISSLNILIGSVYIHPNSTLLTYEQYISSVEINILQFSNHTYIFLVDFNLPDINWANDAHGLHYSSRSSIHVLCVPETFAYYGFYQKNFIIGSTHYWTLFSATLINFALVVHLTHLSLLIHIIYLLCIYLLAIFHAQISSIEAILPQLP